MEIFAPENILLNLHKEPKDDAIVRAGKMLLERGYITEPYIAGMLARDEQLSVAIGNCIAIPHGEERCKKYIKEAGIVMLTYPDAIDWNERKVHIVIGIAAAGSEHNDILGNIVDIFDTEACVQNFLKLTDADKDAIVRMFLTYNQ